MHPTRNAFLALSAVLAQVLTAQSWCFPGSTWHYEYKMNISGIGGIAEYKYVSDTVISSVNCQKIRGTFTGTLNGGSHTVVPGWKHYYTYENNKVVFVYNGASFDTVVDFKAVPGDRWLRPGSQLPGPCNSRRAFVVKDTGHVSINGFWLRTIDLTYTSSVSFSNMTYTISVPLRAVERVYLHGGDYHGGNDMMPFFCEIDGMIAELPRPSFRCYEDSLFPTYNVGNAGCSSLTGIESIYPDELRIFPALAESRIFLEGGPAREEQTVVIIDLTGREVYTGPCEAAPPGNVRVVSVSHLAPGVYSVILKRMGQVVQTARFVRI